MAFFSVVIPVYGTGDVLGTCLDSVLKQSFDDVEVIIVDDASPDNANEVARTYLTDERVMLVVHQENMGPHLSRLDGTFAANGEYLLFVDPDDVLMPGTLQALHDRLVEHPVELLHFGIQTTGVNGVTAQEAQDFENFVNSDLGYLRGLDTAKVCFHVNGGYRQDWRITNHVISLDLAQRAFAQMTEEPLRRAEDSYEYFVVALCSRESDSFDTCKGYGYNYGGGVTGTYTISAERYGQFCQWFQECFDAAENFLLESKRPLSRDFFVGFKAKNLELLANDWLVRVPEEEKADAARLMCDVFGEATTASELWRLIRDRAYGFAASLTLPAKDDPLHAWITIAKTFSPRYYDRHYPRYCENRLAARAVLEDMETGFARNQEVKGAKADDMRIFVSVHKQSDFFDSSILTPVHVGAEMSGWNSGDIQHDNEGDNISTLNPYYCELTAQYWAWKNVDLDYYGFCHYRRYFNFSDTEYEQNPYGEVMDVFVNEQTQAKYGLDDATIRAAIEGYDVVTTPVFDIREFPEHLATVVDQYDAAMMLHVKDLQLAFEVAKEMYPDYAEDVDSYAAGSMMCFCNMFVMKKELFHTYCAWLFPILEKCYQMTDMTTYSVEALRTPGHLSERLLNVFLNHQMRVNPDLLVKRVQVVHFEHTDPIWFHTSREATTRELGAGEPVVPVVLAADNNYVPMVTTTITSMLENASPHYFYDIHVLEDGITGTNKQIVTDFCKKYPNARVSFFYVGEKIRGYQLETSNAHISKETYYRFLIQEVLPGYDKVLYLDSDLIIEGDVSQLFRTDLGDNMIGATIDVDYLANLNLEGSGRYEYSKDVLNLEDPYQYFQAGVLVLNTKAMREKYSVSDWLRFSLDTRLIYNDQDVLNERCQGRVTLLDQRWNVMHNCGGRVDNLFKAAPAQVYRNFMAARSNPYVVHYAGWDKPWKFATCDESQRYWKYARLTPYYEQMLAMMDETISDRIANDVVHMQPSPARWAIERFLPEGTLRRKICSVLRGLTR